ADGRAGRPRVVAALLAPTAATVTGAAGAGGLGGLRGGVLERRTHLVDVELVDGALLALAGLVGALAQPAGHDDPGTAVQRLRDVLGGLAPDRAAQEQRVAVLPVVGLLVEE